MKEIDGQHKQTFSDIRRLGEDKTEYWSARDLQPVLEYSSWQNFMAIIKKTIKACKNSGTDPSDHFNEVIKMVPLGSGAKRKPGDKESMKYAFLTHIRKDMYTKLSFMYISSEAYTSFGENKHILIWRE